MASPPSTPASPPSAAVVEVERKRNAAGLDSAYLATVGIVRQATDLLIPNRPEHWPLLIQDIWIRILDFANEGLGYCDGAYNQLKVEDQQKVAAENFKSLRNFGNICRATRFLAERNPSWDSSGADLLVYRYIQKRVGEHPGQSDVQNQVRAAFDVCDPVALKDALGRTAPDLPIASDAPQNYVPLEPISRLLHATILRKYTWEKLGKVVMRIVDKVNYGTYLTDYESDDEGSRCILVKKNLSEQERIDLKARDLDFLPVAEQFKRWMDCLDVMLEMGWCDPKSEAIVFYAYMSSVRFSDRWLRKAVLEELCVKRKYNCNIGSWHSGFTAAHFAVDQGDAESLATLLDCGADPTVGLTKEVKALHTVGTTAIDLARHRLGFGVGSDSANAVAALLRSRGYSV